MDSATIITVRSIIYSDSFYEIKINLNLQFNSLTIMLFFLLQRGGLRDCIPAPLLLVEATNSHNRLKPVQTGRFHLGLVFSRWRRGKFGLTSRPFYTPIGGVVFYGHRCLNSIG